MWEIYSGRNQGLAVRSTIDALSRAFPAAEKDDAGQLLRAGLVEYIDPNLVEPMPRLINQDDEVIRKRQWYAFSLFFLRGRMAR